MERARELDVALAEGRRLMEVAATTDLDARVPSCPDWSIGELVGHVAWVHRWVTTVLTTPEGERPSRKTVPPSPEGPEVLTWYAEGLGTLDATLRATDPDREVVVFGGTGPARFWSRRMAHENALHRWDIEVAAGLEPAPIAGDVALDGIEEALEVMMPPRFALDEFGPNGETLHLHTTDLDTIDGVGEGDGEWIITFGAEGVEVTHGHAKGDAAVRGTASDLALFVYSRLGVDRLQAFGDDTVATRFQDAAHF
ncbi:MAG: maleylpyruvate isomerase family mycothiol-dependent enzyme [Actinomycetota bacterium]|nr:maleylpyruvate isomerase family mycothiol-dependent enzyme [Actinomycetota bacterium]